MVENEQDNITADPHARYNYQLGKDIPPNQSIRLSFDLEHVEGDHDWQVGIVYSTTENAYQGNMIYFTATSGHNEINFVTPGYFWRVRLLHIPTAQDMEFNLDNFHIENLTQDSASKCHAAVISATDYSPFGAPLPGRTYQASEYRFGFNSKEKDDETNGTANSYDFGARIYDARLGKMFKVDPYFSVYPGLTPYSGLGGNPITNTDAGGKLIIFVSGYGPTRSAEPSLMYPRHWDVEMRQNAAATMDNYKAMYFRGSSKPLTGFKLLFTEEKKAVIKHQGHPLEMLGICK